MSDVVAKELAPLPLKVAFVTPLEKKMAAFGSAVGMVVGSGIGLATAGIGIPATIPMGIAGAGLGAVVGRKLEDRGVTFGSLVTSGVKGAVAIGSAVGGAGEKPDRVTAVARKTAGVVVTGVGCAVVAGTAAAVAIPAATLDVAAGFFRAFRRGFTEQWRRMEDR